MKMIVGLGNPGLLYKATRHNVGFSVIDEFCKKNNLKLDEKKMNGIYGIFNINKEKVLILKPLKYMNLSGEVVRDFINFYKIDINNILVINDDMDINFGNYKLKLSGSSAGHNGLKNIEENLKTNNYKRLKIGISKNEDIEKKNYVLGKFSSDEKKVLKDIFVSTNDILLDFLTIDFEKLMSKYNKKQ